MAAPKHIYWDTLPLGEQSDGAIARATGVSHQAVRQARQQRGIASSKEWRRQFFADLTGLTARTADFLEELEPFLGARPSTYSQELQLLVKAMRRAHDCARRAQ